jgi:hypothetical protein
MLFVRAFLAWMRGKMMSIKFLISIAVICEMVISIFEFDDSIVEIKKIIIFNLFLLLKLDQLAFF